MKPFPAKPQDAHFEEEINKLSKGFRRCQAYFGIHSDDISNFNESACPIEVISGKNVLPPADFQVSYISDSENKELVAIIATINWG
ncbi:hypothetical protein GcC1_115012 [Golovinomyces cichoracearum]|uniref:Uncharacterized protein n=1 Tax=Golovinomyces cichoracearum TaxID=62708 RepID=A0A420I839_9PEZI|nr:hypothetical protein GcC1_115012 [Golovinomyces cichoracearum]